MEGLARGAAALVFAATLAKAPAAVGAWALASGLPHAAATLSIERLASGVALLHIAETGRPDAAMHVAIVSDDFKQFSYANPTRDATTGVFELATTALDPSKRYYLFAETQPRGMGEQAFRFVIPATTHPAPSSTPSAPSGSPTVARTDDYEVTISSATVEARAPQPLHIAIVERGNPAVAMEPLLGGPAQAVLVNESTLTYARLVPTPAPVLVRGLPMHVPAAHTSPNMVLALPPLAPGTYALWIAFATERGRYAVPFTLDVR